MVDKTATGMMGTWGFIISFSLLLCLFEIFIIKVFFFFKKTQPIRIDPTDRNVWIIACLKEKNQSCKGACSLVQFLPFPLVLQPALLLHLRGLFGSGSI